MKVFVTIISLFLLSLSNLSAQLNRNISVNNFGNNIFSISVDPQLHYDYGLAYPVTYKFSLPPVIKELKAYKKYSFNQNWVKVPEKTSNDFFNGIEAARFDYTNNNAFLSISFSNLTDTIYLKITDNSDNNVSLNFLGISKYYDNRQAAVTCSIDDWQWAFVDDFRESIWHLRKNNLWVTAGIISDSAYTDDYTWQQIQTELDSGLVEAAAHSRNHLHIPYDDPYNEVTGCKEDIINNLTLPPLFRKGNEEYVYVWIAPYGEYDNATDSLVSVDKFLVTRLVDWYNYSFSAWQKNKNNFAPVGMAYEMGETPWGGIYNIDTLNNTFDEVVKNGGIYHLMFHPQVLADSNSWQKGYPEEHLEYISNRKNIWYTAFGHLYLYHLLKYKTPATGLHAKDKDIIPSKFVLFQNYPNPFNSTTKIKYSIPNVETNSNAFVQLKVYDLLGKEVATLVNENQLPGNYVVTFNGSNLSSGIYFYRIAIYSDKLQTEGFTQTKKLLLMK